jgi:uncharacterized protein YggT (Ycf19 family)
VAIPAAQKRDPGTMSDALGDPLVREYERRAEEAEASPVPVFLKIARVIVWIVYAIVLATAILLTLNFLLRLFGANSDNAFTVWVYRSTDRAMQPFRGIFPTHQLDDSSAALDFSVLFAALVYFVIALLIDIGLRWLTNRLHRQQRQTVALRQQADAAAHDALAREQAAQHAAREAAAREYAARQAAADQYAIAHAAATEAVSRQAARDQVPPTTPAQPGSNDPLPPPAG